jgi:hypothetical protein
LQEKLEIAKHFECKIFFPGVNPTSKNGTQLTTIQYFLQVWCLIHKAYLFFWEFSIL